VVLIVATIVLDWFSQTTLPEFQKTEFQVVRQHEEFVWLHDRFEENEQYAGYLVRHAALLLNTFSHTQTWCSEEVFVCRFHHLHQGQILMHQERNSKS